MDTGGVSGMWQIEHGSGFQLGFESGKKEDVEMSSSSGSESWLDRWWPLLLILFGLTFVSLLVSFFPKS
jgi:hypothetical protein